MKNVIHIIIDAYCYNNINRNISGLEVTPFLNSLARDYISYDNIYSQAPYTEASQVTLLSGENTLDSGGYLLGNCTVRSTFFEEYQKQGYKTIFTYSPYVYSKAYLRGVDFYFYSRLYSIEPLYLYRLGYYYEKYKNSTLKDTERQLCVILIKEAIECWRLQCEAILNKTEETKIIFDWVDDLNKIQNTYNLLVEQEKQINLDEEKYLNDIFENWDGHILRKTNKEFIKRKSLDQKERLINAYQAKMEMYQKKYSRIVLRQPIDIGYVFNTAIGGRKYRNDAMHLLGSYKNFYLNKRLSSYLYDIDEKAKTEVGMNKMFDEFYIKIEQYLATSQNYYAYIHVQDFHLPSVFHSVDSRDTKMVDKEFSEAFELLDAMGKDYRGNIIADLSARYCDSKVKDLFNKIKQVDKDFVFVVTADHGFPLYDNPPRPFIYNQTYVEAFHIPLIIYDGQHKDKPKGIYSNMDTNEIIKKIAGLEPKYEVKPREYILHEYGGPGCPDIGEKPIWYIYMDSHYSLSLECSLKDTIKESQIKTVYDISKDKNERYNLKHKLKGNNDIDKILSIISNRHQYLKSKYEGDKFLEVQFENIKTYN